MLVILHASANHQAKGEKRMGIVKRIKTALLQCLLRLDLEKKLMGSFPMKAIMSKQQLQIHKDRWFSVGICNYKPGYKSHG